VKNKKLFAILTLVCFMFTLMPVAAFAAEGAVLVNTKDSVKVTAGDTLALSTTGATYGYTVYYAVDEDGEGAAVTDTASMVLKNVGDYKVYAIGMAANATYKSDVAEIVAGIDTPAKKVDTLVAWADGLDLILDDYAKVKVVAGDYEYELRLVAGADTTIATNNGFVDGDGDMTVQLFKSNDDWATESVVKNAELKFDTIGYVDVVLEDGNKTNSAGKVDFTAISDTTGVWTVVVSYEDAELEIEVTASNGRAANVSVYNAAVAPKNIKSTIDRANVDFKFVDASGVAVEPADINAVTNITVVSQPADSDMDGDDFTLVEAIDPVTGKVGKGVYRLAGNGVSYFEEEGVYEIKVSLESGKSATAKVTLAKQGDVVRIMFAGAPATVAYDATAGVTDVTSRNAANLVGAYGIVSVDAKGVTSSVTSATEFGYTGKAVTEFDTATGKALLDADEDFIGTTITVYAVYKDFTASTTIDVIEGAAGIEYAAADLEVATNNVVYANIVDGDGKVVKNATLAAVTEPIKVIVLDKPENAVVSAKANQTLVKGQVELNLLASAAGEYKIQTIVTLAGGKMISDTETFVVGAKTGTFEDIVVVSLGADKMIVNNEVVALDVAPFIENNRTMMQFNVLYVFGIDVEWVAETQSIVAEGNGLKVVMQLGSKVATVNGAEVALDVAPYTVNGRTVVPVGFITGLLDITPTFTYNADGTIADILFTK